MDGFRRSRVGAVLVVALLVLMAVVWVASSVHRAGRYAHRIEASGVAPYAPRGWVADDAGTLSGGRLSYTMHDHSGYHVQVTVRSPIGPERGLEPYQRQVLERYGVVVSIRIVRDPDPDGMLLPDAIAAVLAEQDARWLADRLCWSCRLAGHLVDAGVLFG